MAQDGPWHPGIQSQIPPALQPLATIYRAENVRSTWQGTDELRQLTGLPETELVAFRPERLVLHELLIRVTANLSVPDGSRIEDLGINFREMTRVLLQRHIEPQMPGIVAEFERVRTELERTIAQGLQELLTAGAAAAAPPATSEPGRGFLARLLGRREAKVAPASAVVRAWGPEQIHSCEERAAASAEPLQAAAWRALGRVLAALFKAHGQAWGTSELIVRVATDLAANVYGSGVVGALVGPMVRQAAVTEGYGILPSQQRPVVINTKGASASGKSTLRPLQKKLAGALGVRWEDFALISPDIWRKQLLDYGSLGAAYRYAGAFTSQELQIVDQKLDRYMARKHERGDMAHLLIDRFRFDSFAADSDEAGSNLLTRFGQSLYLFFVITPPAQLVERAWKRGLEFGRYKAVDDTLAHSVEAYTGIPDVLFTWVRRADKNLQIELLDNSVAFGELPRTVAFGTNYTFNILDVERLLDIERFGRVDVNATEAAALYPNPGLLAVDQNTTFLARCLRAFRHVNFAEQDSGLIYLHVAGNAVQEVDAQALARAAQNPDIRAALRDVLPGVFAADVPGFPKPRYLQQTDEVLARSTLGEWGGATGKTSRPS